MDLEDAVDVADGAAAVSLLPARLEDDLHDVATGVLRTKLRHCTTDSSSTLHATYWLLLDSINSVFLSNNLVDNIYFLS